MNSIEYTELPIIQAEKARAFCLSVIKETYGFDYREDWHNDLDSLLDPEGIYAPTQRGIFIYAVAENEIVGTIGVRPLSSKPALSARFQDRGYQDGSGVASLWRAYVAKNMQNKGVGKSLVEKAEEYIRGDSRYHTIYLHTSKLNPNAVIFWHKRGFRTFLEEDNEDKTVHMDKKVRSENPFDGVGLLEVE